jgi:hypothetical protein
MSRKKISIFFLAKYRKNWQIAPGESLRGFHFNVGTKIVAVYLS